VLANANVTDVAVNATDIYLTGSDLAIAGRVQLKTKLRWRFALTKTATGTVTPQFLIRFGTGATVTDTARCSITFPSIQTAATDTAWGEIDAILRTIGATATVQASMKLHHKGGVSGFATLAGPQIVNVTSTPFDITVASLKAGVSCHPGATGVWTFQIVDADAVNLT
jgi:hypothetical protein